MSRARLLSGSTALLVTIMVASSGALVTPARADTDHVVNCSNDGPGSLRNVIAAAASGDTIVFDVDCSGATPLVLASLIAISGTQLTIEGGGAGGSLTTISGHNATQLFSVGLDTDLTLDHLELTQAYSAADGAALANVGSFVRLRNSTVHDNHSFGFGGGAIANSAGGELLIESTTFLDNSAPQVGGAIYSNGANTSAYTSTFLGNSATRGGAIGSNDGVLLVRQSTFAGNTAASTGGVGGAINAQGSAAVEISNSTVTGNTSKFGGGLGFTGDAEVVVTNSTVSDNSVLAGGSGSQIGNAAKTLAVVNTIVSGKGGTNCAGTPIGEGGIGHNLQFGDTSCSFTLGAVTGDPHLGGLHDNGGPAETMALGQGSAAIGAADLGTCVSTLIGNIDERGRPRAAGGRCDIGAYDTGGSVAGAASGATTTISSSAAQINAGGGTATITVQAKSASGQSLTVGGDTVTLTTTRATLSAVTDNKNGTYTATLTSGPKKGTATVTGTIDGQQITSTVSISIRAAKPAAATTTITARRVNVGQASGSTQIVVDTRDRFDNDVPTGGARVKLRVTAGKIRPLRDLHNGNYVATLSRSGAKNQVVVITGAINGARIVDNAVVYFK